jgi:hypothetical protein
MQSQKPERPWRRIGAVQPRDLVEARLLLHHAAQLVTAPGRSLLPPRPDDGQTAFEWIAGRDLLAGEWLDSPSGRTRVALDPAAARVLLLAAGGDVVVQRDLAGDTLAAAFDWLEEALGARGIDVSRLSASVPYEVPHHAVADGASFPAAPLPGFEELTRYYADAHCLLEPLVASRADATPLRCWPHHFDLGALVAVGKSSVGLGLSPGDATYPEPYFYVTAWPAPGGSEPLPVLPGGGHWHREEWFGAVLTGTGLTETGAAEGQEARARDFLDAAFRAALALVAGP